MDATAAAEGRGPSVAAVLGIGGDEATAWQDLTGLVATGDLVAEGNPRTRRYRRPVRS